MVTDDIQVKKTDELALLPPNSLTAKEADNNLLTATWPTVGIDYSD